MDKAEERLRSRFWDLADDADKKGIVTFSDFLNLNELNIFHSMAGQLSFVKWEVSGGYEPAERQIIAFIPDALYYDWDYPISCLKIEPLNGKFAEELTHRDYLGTILGMGLDRSKLGDILVDGNQAWVFCVDSIADFICTQLVRVRRTSVLCRKADHLRLDIAVRTESIKGSVASIRLDSLIALACKGSRSSLASMIEEGKVFVNGKLITSNDYTPKEQDLISVRGIGKFRYCGILSQTKKGRYYIEIQKFI